MQGEVLEKICPILSIGKDSPAKCTETCAWFDPYNKRCEIVGISSGVYWLHDVAQNLDEL